MANFFRTLFGFGRSSGNRTVVGAPVAVDVKAAAYVKASNKRLNTLQELYLKYKGTPHAEKLKTVLEKTKKIHHYLLAKQRAHELEIFHIQYTDHFINTFSKIMEVHERHIEPVVVTPPPVRPVAPPVAPPAQRAPHAQRPRVHHSSQRPFEERIEDVMRRIETETIKGIHTAHKVSEMVRRVAGQAPYVTTETLDTHVPALAVPTIAINTYSRIYYLREQGSEGAVTGEIGFTSSDEDKEAFVAHVSSRLGIDKDTLTYMGNTTLAIPGKQGRNPAAYVPVLSWNGCSYALNLQDYRLFPVVTHRKK